jgi:pantetheine-phosphate adenylyltransferase
MSNFKLAAMGGTFDRLHKGHRTLLKFAFDTANEVYLGITVDNMNFSKQYSYCIQPYNERIEGVKNYLTEIGKLKQVRLFELKDIYGPTLSDFSIDCLVCSPLTKSGADYINKERTERSLSTLPIAVCEMERDSEGDYISSTRIRKGEINREGFVYKNLLKQDIKLSQRQKDKVKIPFGELLRDPSREDILKYVSLAPKVIAVGDYVSSFLVRNTISVDTFIFDSKTKRRNVEKPVEEILNKDNLDSCLNLAGGISKEFSEAIENSLNISRHLKVEGEEDLAVVPVTLLSPLGTCIFYGQPNEGMVAVTVTEEKKEWCKKFLE